MKNIEKHIISSQETVREVLSRLDQLAANAILFLVDDNNKLIGALTDGDIRRGLIKGLGLENNIIDFIRPDPKFFKKDTYSLKQMQEWRDLNFRIIPVINENDEIIDIVNFQAQKSYLPISAVIMAGGKGTRLKPLTDNTPKPLLKVGDKPIVEYNIDRLKSFGIHDLTISIKYLGEQIEEYFGTGDEKEISIKYISEEEPLGTIGAVGLIEEIENDYVLVMNSDILTNIDYEDIFQVLLEQGGDMITATTPYEVEIPYGVVETKGAQITSLKEKPTYTYYSNAGIYIIKKKWIDLIPKNEHFNATDLMETLISQGKKVLHYAILGYWLDIGKPHDYEKAQRDIHHIKF